MNDKLERLVRLWRCHHEWRFERGIYGDEINHVSLSKIYRSWWKCRLCGKRQLRHGGTEPLIIRNVCHDNRNYALRAQRGYHQYET